MEEYVIDLKELEEKVKPFNDAVLKMWKQEALAKCDSSTVEGITERIFIEGEIKGLGKTRKQEERINRRYEFWKAMGW